MSFQHKATYRSRRLLYLEKKKDNVFIVAHIYICVLGQYHRYSIIFKMQRIEQQENDMVQVSNSNKEQKLENQSNILC